tara:strand:- start:574 stop:942 length:369 start_codon:yes stop_codon:yes gene_type:complete
MEWMIQYKLKGDTEIKQELVELDLDRKPHVIKWWKKARNSKKDLELINCSNSGDLNIKHIPLEGVDIIVDDMKASCAEIRKATGYGLMDCKKALKLSAYNVQSAIEYIKSGKIDKGRLVYRR